ncbi:MAG: chemotaxis protein CheW [Kofleriaceae bacterium]|nr:chemotaxis protein CheW [Kofleriaceae bacterium]
MRNTIAQIQEIIEYPDTLVQTPGGHSFVSGVLNLRNDLIPIIDARKLYGLEKTVLSTPPKILIIEHKDHKFGFVVDRISSIVTIDSARNLELPSLLYKESQKSFDDDIHSAVQMDDENAAPLFILRLDRIVGRIQESPKSSDLPPVSEELALAIQVA